MTVSDDADKNQDGDNEEDENAAWRSILEPRIRVIPQIAEARGKRLSDLVLGGLFGLVIWAPMLLAMLAVKLSSPGPVIYRQVRMGRGGRSFTMYKIRTMAHNCEAATGALWSTGKSDPRTFVVGQFLRATHIDEFPQLWNVFKGDMSLVGPRPERPVIIAERLIERIPDFLHRNAIRPGVTGLAQVQLPPDQVIDGHPDWDGLNRKLTCDIFYVHHHNVSLDLRLIAATALGILGLPFRRVGPLLKIPQPHLAKDGSDAA